MTTATTTAALLRPVLDDLGDLLDRIGPEDRRRPTPCAEYDVAALVDHVVGWVTTFATGLADPWGRAPAGPTPVVGDPAEAIRDAARLIDRGVRDGAGERPLSLGDAVMPGDMAVAMILWEYQVHGWDLAAAVDRDWAPDDAGLAASLACAPGMLTSDFQGEGKPFGPRVTVGDDAPAMDRLVALSGRDPLWTAGDRAALLVLASMRTVPGRRDTVAALMLDEAAGVPRGCTSYVVAVDPNDDDMLWVSETWVSRRHHAASLRLPEVVASIEKAMPMLTGEFSQQRLRVRATV